MKKLGIGIIGCGAIHEIHARAIAGSEFGELIAVADIVEEKAKASGSKNNCEYYTDYKKLLEDERIDVVHICTPHYLHSQTSIDVMRSGKNVFTEKPMAINCDTALEMIKVSEETGKKLGVCFQNRYNSTSIRLKEILDSGKVGRIIGAKAFVTWFRDEKYYTESGWRGTWEKEGGGGTDKSGDSYP